MISYRLVLQISVIMLLMVSLTGESFAQASQAAQASRDAQAMSAARKKRTEALSKRHNMKDAKTRAAVVRQLKEAEDELQTAVRRRARAKGLKLEGDKPGGGRFRLIDFDENDLPVYEQTENANAAISTATDQVRSSATYNRINGSSVTIGLWEATGIPRTTHQELTGRVTILDGFSTVGSHATHVAGTLIATGINPSVRGMAIGARISAFGSGNAGSEMTANGASAPNTTKLYLSNHSYGVGQGWEGSVWQGIFTDDGDPTNDFEKDFGRYAFRSVEWDGISYNLPYYQIFVSSGNHKNDGPPATGSNWTYGATTYTYDPAVHPPGDGEYKNGYDNMEGGKLAKNAISVGATADAVTNGVRDPSKAVTRSFSSRGPADDGRIKPDIVANGASLLSSDNGSDTDTGSKSGTSMASPNACGSAALLIDYYSNRFPTQAMRASTLKALILHTADDRGNPGPDYKYGWGLMNTEAAADVIKLHADNDGGAAILESSVSTSLTSRTHTFGWNGTTPLRVTLCWTDPPGTEKDGHENREKVLVNDLNLTISGPDGTHYPYVMPHVGDWSVDSITDNAVTGVNTVDNVEQVYLPGPTSGNYVITVDFAGSLTDNLQNYSLIVTGQTAAEIEVEDNGPPVVALTDNSGVRDFGAAAPSEASIVRTFTVRNTGGSPLTGLAVTKSGTHQNDFTVSALSATELEAGQTASFSVSYDPLGDGGRTAALQVTSNDADENPFDINLTAIGLTELEAWRFEHFGTTANTGDAADDFDFDFDSLVNLVEFGLATDPTVADPQPFTFTLEEAGAKMTYERSVLAMTEYTFEVTWAEDLSTVIWSTEGVTEEILEDDGIMQDVEASLPIGISTKRFYRIRISPK